MEFGEFEEADDVWVDSVARADDVGDGDDAGDDDGDDAGDERAGTDVAGTDVAGTSGPYPSLPHTQGIDEVHTVSVSAARYEEMVRDELGAVGDSGGFGSSFAELEGRYPEFLAPPGLRWPGASA